MITRKLLTNEERLRRKRARWARRKAAAETATPSIVKGLAHQRRSGKPDRAEKLVSDAEMALGWRFFWRQRGIDTPPCTTAGVLL